MFFTTSRSKKEKIIAILDIGSASVGGALVSLSENSSPEVLVSFREDMIFQQDLNLERFTSSMLVALGRVLVKLEKSGEGKPRTFFCVLSSPWYKSETKIIDLKKDKSFVVTRKILDDLIDKEVVSFRNEIKGYGKIKGDIKIIDIQNIQVKLNGYETNNPQGKYAEDIKIALFIGLGSKKILEMIEDKISRNFNLSEIKFSTFSLSVFSVLRDIFTDMKDFLFLDMTGEMTDIALIKDGILLETSSFSMGRNFILRRIASNTNSSLQEAESLLNMLSTDKIDKITRTRMESILNEARKEWLVLFTQSITSLSKKVPVPNTIFFIADLEIKSWLAESLKRKELEKFTMTNEIFNLKFLDKKIFEKLCLFKKKVNKDPFIILETIFVDRNQKIL